MMLVARFVAVALIQTAVLGSMIYERATILRTGTAIMLKTEPIDPRDLFRGDYVILNYEISQLPTEKLEGDNEFERLQPIYVALEERGQFWSATGIYNGWPTIIGDQVIIKGTVDWTNDIHEDCPLENLDCDYYAQPLISTEVNVSYGLDSYFVPEGSGKEIEDAVREDSEIERVAVEVAVDDEGTAAIKGLYLDDELFYEESLF